MADRQFQIKLSVQNDSAGAQAAASDLDNIAKKTGQAGESAKGLNDRSREMQTLFSRLDSIVPGLGEALRAAFDPEAAGIVGLIIFIELAAKLFEKMKQDADEFKKALATQPDLSGIKNAVESLASTMGDADRHAQDFLGSMEQIMSAQRTIADASGKHIAALEHQKDVEHEIAEAKKEQAAAELDLMRLHGQITPEQYDLAKIKLDSTSAREAAQTEVEYLNREKSQTEQDREAARRNAEDLGKQEPGATERAGAADNAVKQAEQRRDHAKAEMEQTAKAITEGKDGEPSLLDLVQSYREKINGISSQFANLTDGQLREQTKHPLTIPGGGYSIQHIEQYLKLADHLADLRRTEAGFGAKARGAESDVESAKNEQAAANKALADLNKKISDNANSVNTLTGKIEELNQKLDAHKDDGRVFDAQDRARRAQALPQFERDLGVNTDEGAMGFVNQYLQSINHLNTGHGTRNDELVRQAFTALQQSTKESDNRTYLLILDLVRHKGNLAQALADLQRQLGTIKTPRT